MAIPKPSFKGCDETSLTLSWPEFDTKQKHIRFEYKKYGQDWSQAQSIPIDPGSSEVKIIDITDLDPGTPYFVRLVLYKEGTENLEMECGPECVFDTKPIDCTPKKNTCMIM